MGAPKKCDLLTLGAKIFGDPQVGFCADSDGKYSYSRYDLGVATNDGNCLAKCNTELLRRCRAGSEISSVSGCQYDHGVDRKCYLYDQAAHIVSIASGDTRGICWIALSQPQLLMRKLRGQRLRG